MSQNVFFYVANMNLRISPNASLLYVYFYVLFHFQPFHLTLKLNSDGCAVI